MSYRVAGKIGVFACALLLAAEARPAQNVPPPGAMAEDAQMAMLIRQCKDYLDIDDQAAEKLFKTIVSAMLDAYGDTKTEAAMDAAFNKFAKDVKEKGPRDWCELDAALWLEIRYPELAKK